MKKIVFLITVILVLGSACSSPAPKPQPKPEEKGHFAVEHHEDPLMVLDDDSKTIDNIQQFKKTLFFKKNSAKVTPEGRRILNGLMGMMQMDEHYTIHVIGIAEATEKRPKVLAMRRALSVAQFIHSAGIDRARITVNGQTDDFLGCKGLPNPAPCREAERVVVLTNIY